MTKSEIATLVRPNYIGIPSMLAMTKKYVHENQMVRRDQIGISNLEICAKIIFKSAGVSFAHFDILVRVVYEQTITAGDLKFCLRGDNFDLSRAFDA